MVCNVPRKEISRHFPQRQKGKCSQTEAWQDKEHQKIAAILIASLNNNKSVENDASSEDKVKGNHKNKALRRKWLEHNEAVACSITMYEYNTVINLYK